MPISPTNPAELSLRKRQFSAFSKSALGELRRQLFFLWYCERERNALPAAPERTTVLVLDADGSGRGRAAAAPGGPFFEAWMDRAGAGERPAIVLGNPVAGGAPDS